MHLSPLEVKLIGELRFKVESPIHIGVGADEVRRGLLRLPSGEAIIPASTWKGCFRRISEELAKTVQYDGLTALAIKLYHEGRGGISYRGHGEERKLFDEFVEEVFTPALNGEAKPPMTLGGEELEEFLKRELGYDDREIENAKRGEPPVRGMAENYLALHCPIGSLYGNRIRGGKIRFIDSIIDADQTHIRTGVGIDRKSGKVRKNILYFIESVSSRIDINLWIIADNLKPGKEDSKLLGKTLKTIMKMGISIGGGKSSGMGQLKLKEGRFHILKMMEDKNILAVGNPLKKTEKYNLDKLIKWLTK